MKIYKEPTDADIVDCPYINAQKFRQRYAILLDLTPQEFDMMLTNGWRHFGYFFFIPNCQNCNACTPIRTLVQKFKPTKSQRRNLNKNDSKILVEFSDLIYSDEIYSIYKKHSHSKFNMETTEKDFIDSFFTDVLQGSSKLSLYRFNGKLVGVGFIDISETGISSIYFCYDTDYSHLGLGVYSVLKEIEYCTKLNKDYYYLGYYIKENKSMEYKNRYTPAEVLSWDRGAWEPY